MRYKEKPQASCVKYLDIINARVPNIIKIGAKIHSIKAIDIVKPVPIDEDFAWAMLSNAEKQL
ncbi:MAG: hypothetical protein QM784_10520 [Polyangiaceae bacterium]